MFVCCQFPNGFYFLWSCNGRNFLYIFGLNALEMTNPLYRFLYLLYLILFMCCPFSDWLFMCLWSFNGRKCLLNFDVYNIVSVRDEVSVAFLHVAIESMPFIISSHVVKVKNTLELTEFLSHSIRSLVSLCNYVMCSKRLLYT